MWRRWNNYNGNRGPYIGHPTLIETTVEDGYLETIPEVDSIKSKRSSASTALPELPFRAMPQAQRVMQQHREPVWSQPSPTVPDYEAYQNQYSPNGDFPYVSPASSPPRSNLDAASEVSSISPIEPEGSSAQYLPLPGHGQRSRIPQRVTSDRIQRTEQPKQDRHETKWDSYSGEPTMDDSGRPSTVRPGVPDIQPVEYQYPQLKERTKQILAGLREREAAGKTEPEQGSPTSAYADTQDHIVRKEPWKGYSGRAPILDPVHNNPTTKFEPIARPQPETNYTKPNPPAARAESPTYTLRSVSSEESIKPIAPLKIVTKSRNTTPQSSEGSKTPPFFDAMHSTPSEFQPSKLQSPFTSPGPTRSIDIPAPMASARADSPLNDPVPETPRTPPIMHYQTTTPIKAQQMPDEHDVSRFSWTTYATTVTESPGAMARIYREESPPPPLPQMPRLNIKKRPVSDATFASPYTNKNALPAKSSSITRKPVGGKPRQSSGAISQLSLSKTLPQIPDEIEATDKIANLEAQMSALAVRKYNTNRIVRDLNDNLKKNAVAYDMWKRKDVAQRITDYEEDLQSIANEEHDLGLLLHRALRKRDTEDNYEVPTGLWIRRVTS